MSNYQKKGRKAYLNNYKPKKGGGYEYTGKKYEYQGSEGFKKMLKKLWLLGGGAFVCMIAAGCLTPCPALCSRIGSRCQYCMGSVPSQRQRAVS